METHFLNFLEGLDTSLSPLLIPKNGLAIQVNCLTTYKLGAILKRVGYQRVGNAPLENGKPITGLHNFRQSAFIQKMLATVNNANDSALQLFYSTGGNWTEIPAAETAWAGYEDCQVEMEDFLGYCFFVGYDSYDNVFLPNRTLTGTTFGTTNTVNMPQAKYIIRYRDRLYLGNCYYNGSFQPFRVYFSNAPTGGTIDWNPDENFFDVDFSEEITGLGENWDRLIIFTEYSAYMYNQDEKKKVWDIGCASHRTIKSFGPYLVWADMNNVWLSTGGHPQAIGGRVIDFIRYSDMRKAFAEIVDEEYHLYIGEAIVNGVVYSNCVLIYNFPTQTWRVHTYAHPMSIFATFYQNGQNYLVMGSANGNVFQLGKYTDEELLTSDAGEPIFSWWQTGFLPLNAPHIRKKIVKVIAYSERAQGLLLKGRIVDTNTMSLSEFFEIGQLKEYINEFQVNGESGHFLQLEGTEISKMPYWSYFGHTIFYIPDVIVKP